MNTPTPPNPRIQQHHRRIMNALDEIVHLEQIDPDHPRIKTLENVIQANRRLMKQHNPTQ